MIHGGDSRAEARGEAGYAAHADRPVRLSRGDAKRIASEMVDDVLRGGERAQGAGVSNASVADALDLSESRVRKLRDPHEDATLTLADLLMLPEVIARPLLGALRARRRELHGDPVAPCTTEDQAHVTLATAGATVATIAQALQDGVITSAEAPGVAAQCRGLMRDLERLAVRCTAEVKP